MEKRNINKPIPPVPQAIDGWPNKGERITVHEPGVKITPDHINGKIIIRAKGEFVPDEIVKEVVRQNILFTPPPYDQAWLDANGLKVVYSHGKAVLQFKK